MTIFSATSGHPISGLTLHSGDSAYVFSGGQATSVTLLDGANFSISSGGVADFTVLSGGFETVSSGGVARFTVARGGQENVLDGGTASFTVVSGTGTEVVHSGGRTTGTVVSGLEEIYAGGIVSDSVINGGIEYVYSGGTAIGTEVNSGGSQELTPGGTASNTVVHGGGTEIIDAGGIASFTVVSRGGAIDLPDLAFTSGGSAVVNNSDLLTVVEGGVSATIQLAGTYTGEVFQTAKDNVVGTILRLTEPPRILLWTGVKDSNFGNAADWRDLTNGVNPAALPPNETDVTEFLSGTGTITGTGTAEILEFGGTVGWNLTSGASLTAMNGVTVGLSGNSKLLINNGAGIFGLGATDEISGALVTVDGAGSTWRSAGELIVGGLASASLSIRSAGSLGAAALGVLPAMVLGASAGVNGSLSVSGAGSRATLLGQLNVGQAGDGSLSISDQGTVATGNDAALDPSEGVDIASEAGGSGRITVSGTRSVLVNAGRFVVGDAGLGNLAVLSGATVSTAQGAGSGLPGLVIAGSTSAAGSTVSVSGTGSTLTVSGLLDVGEGGSGALSLNGGATVSVGSLDAGTNAAAVGQIGVTGAGTSLTVSGDAIVADDGTGILSILNGATFAAANLTIGALGNSSGAVIVSGAGSALNISGALNIGTALGIGDLTVGPGAAVHASVVNLRGQVVLEGGLLDPTVQYIAQDRSGHGFGTIAADQIIVEGSIEAGAAGASQKLLVVQGTVLGGGALTINGIAQASGAPGVLHINAGGTLELTGPVLNAATTTFTDGLASQSTYTVNNSEIDVTFADGNGVLKLDDIAGFAGTITSFQAGDAFVISGGTLSGPGVSNGNTLTVSDGGTGGIDRIIFGQAIDPESFCIVNGNTIVACFAAGTAIATVDGLVPVEKLCVGDRLVTADGTPEPIIWIGSRLVNCARHPAPETVWPVRVRTGAFGAAGPARDLFLSPDHAVFVNEVLVPVKLLINGTSIAQVKQAQTTYYHVELRRHDVILAEGLAVESYLDVGHRANFANGGETVRLFPDFAGWVAPDAALAWETRGAAPLVLAGEALDDARRCVDRQEKRRLAG